jgi:hypothetical protein
VDRDTAGSASAPAAPPGTRQRKGAPTRPAAGISADPRLTAWIRRAVIALVIGVGVSIWGSWRWGLTAAVFVAVLDTIYQSRVMAPIPAEAGATAAQRKTRRHLAPMRRSGYLTLNARAITGSDQVIDHLVIGPSGIWSIDSEQWDKRLPVRFMGSDKKGALYHGPYSQLDRLAHARWEASEASRLLSADLGDHVMVRPAMAIYGPDIRWGVANLRGVEVFSGPKLRKFFRAQTRATRGDHLDAEEIAMISEAADRVLPPLG